MIRVALFFLGVSFGVLVMLFLGTLENKTTLSERINSACKPGDVVYDWEVKIDDNLNPTHTILVMCSEKGYDKNGYIKTYPVAVDIQENE